MPPGCRAGPRPSGHARLNRGKTGQPVNRGSYAGRWRHAGPAKSPPDGLRRAPIGPGRLRDRSSVPRPGRHHHPVGRSNREAPGLPEARGEPAARVAADMEVAEEAMAVAEGTTAAGTAAGVDAPARVPLRLSFCARSPGPTPSSPRSGARPAWPDPPLLLPPSPAPE